MAYTTADLTSAVDRITAALDNFTKVCDGLGVDREFHYKDFVNFMYRHRPPNIVSYDELLDKIVVGDFSQPDLAKIKTLLIQYNDERDEAYMALMFDLDNFKLVQHRNITNDWYNSSASC